MHGTRTQEQWKPVPGYEGYYEVSDHGHVRSLPRVVNQGTRTMKLPGGPMKPTAHPTGHLWINLRRDGASHKGYIHRMVAGAFLGECPEGQEVRHLDGNAANNHVSNLRYGTRSENMHDKVAHGTHFQAAKTHCPAGHRLIWPNLTPARWLERGHRNCRACSSARGHIISRNLPMSEFQRISDQYEEKYLRSANDE